MTTIALPTAVGNDQVLFPNAGMSSDLWGIDYSCLVAVTTTVIDPLFALTMNNFVDLPPRAQTVFGS